ncbi:MAG: helix-turn-helix transcriptional regulator [Stomatobaculum sp.]|nr:helix-turn-helix transcriptional regulator [Stomatobaculum sp.]
MYVNSGYLFNSRVPFKETKKALRVLSAGTYQLHSWPRLPTWRPKGRVDWQLVYISAGKGHFILDGHDVVVPAGNMVLYQPKHEQHYYFLGEDKSQYWFVHFTGREVKNILKHYEIPIDGYIIRTGLSYEYEDLFRKMRDELNECAWGYEEILNYHLRELFITMNRRIHEPVPKIAGFVQNEIDHAKDYFREHYNEQISIEQYAASRNMSTSWFNKCFRSAVGESPMRYILLLRIRNAQILLETTDGTISEIAQIVGYENPMYFSRLFRKEKGLSPSKYRKSFLEKY